MFISAIFTIAKLWNQPRYSLNDEWIKKIWYICPMENSAIKKKIIIFAGKWMKVEIITFKKFSFRKIKVTCSLSYVKSRPKIYKGIYL
jgi:hypothetical protein